MVLNKKAKEYYKKLDKERLEAKKIKDSSPWKYLGYGGDNDGIDDFPQKKPNSATFIAALEWSWSPVNYRQDWYYISTNRSRSHWFFWYCYKDDNDWSNRWVNQIVAIGPKKGTDKYSASIKLLETFWIGERDEYDSPDNSFMYYSFGILSDEEIKKIADKILK